MITKSKKEKQKKGTFPFNCIKYYLILLFLIGGIGHIGASHALSQTISIKLNSGKITELFNIIEENSEYKVLYTENVSNKEVTINSENEEIESILSNALSSLGLKYHINGNQIIVTEDKTIVGVTQQEKRTTITGVVKDNNGDLLIGVTVMIKGTQVTAVTDAQGKYTITSPAIISSPTLTFSYLGMETMEVDTKGKVVINVTLEPNAAMLQEVEVVAFGKQKKESVVGAIQSVNPGDLRIPATNISNALGGRLAGVIAVQRTGEPGADGSNFWIRGISTFNASTSPLIFIDGIESSTSDMNALPPEAIDKFSILKDAAATALYGARGGNGVMLITTKSGSNLEKARVNVRVTQSITAPTKTVEIADGVDYMRMYNEAELSRNPLVNPRFTAEKIQGTIDKLDPLIYPNVDWMDFLFKDFSHSQSANINITGGTQRVDYFASASVNLDHGMLKSNKLNDFSNNVRNIRYSFQSNVNFNITKTTKLGVRLNAHMNDYDSPKYGKDASLATESIYSNLFVAPGVYFAPQLPARNHEDHILFGNSLGGPSMIGGGTFYHPYAEAVTGHTERFTSTFTASLNLDQKLDFLIQGLSFHAKGSFRNYSYTRAIKSYSPFYYAITDYWRNNDGTFDYDYALLEPGTTALTTSNTVSGNRRINLEANLNYQRRFDMHDVSAMFVYYQREQDNNTPSSQDFYATLPQRHQGLSGRITYGFDDRYLFETNFGYTGSENFLEGERWGFFPSVAVGYLVSNEEFFTSLRKHISSLKLRASYGLAGNDQIGNNVRFPYVTNLAYGGITDMEYYFGHNWSSSDRKYGPIIQKFGTLDSSWETSTKLNIGVDAQILKHFNFTFDYFYEKRKDIFMQRRTIIAAAGVPRGAEPYQNIGKVHNRGFDFTLDYNQQINKDLFVSAKGTFTYAQNKIVERDEPILDHPYMSAIGKPLNRYSGHIALGLFKDEDDIANSPEQTFSNKVFPGDIKYADLNGDGKIDGNDVTQIGFPTVPEIVYGLGVSVQYKKWDASIFFQGVARTSNMIRNIHPFTSKQNTVLQFVADDYWSEANPNPNAKYPRLDIAQNTNNERYSTYWLRDMSFLRLKNMEIGFTHKSIRFYLAGQNLLTFSKFKDWDPELGSGNGLKYPTAINGTFGIQITL